MATKIKKSYQVKSKQEEEAKKLEEDKSIKRPIAEGAVAAPIWRRICAYAIDFGIAMGVTALFLFSSNEPTLPMYYRYLYLFSILITQVWLFILIPTDYMKGQTLGRKLLRLYARDIHTHYPLNWWKSLSREYIYGILAFMFTIPFELLHLLFQFVTNKEQKPQTVQMLDIKGKQLILARDTIFHSEVVYLAKKTNKVIEVDK